MIELGNLAPLRELARTVAEWEARVRTRPLPDTDPVVQAIGTIRLQLAQALEKAASVEMDLTAAQYAELKGVKVGTLYKWWQRGKLPEAHMRGGKLVVPVSAMVRDVAA
jgi:pyridoxal biosynthesis lyase PdxS